MISPIKPIILIGMLTLTCQPIWSMNDGGEQRSDHDARMVKTQELQQKLRVLKDQQGEMHKDIERLDNEFTDAESKLAEAKALLAKAQADYNQVAFARGRDRERLKRLNDKVSGAEKNLAPLTEENIMHMLSQQRHINVPWIGDETYANAFAALNDMIKRHPKKFYESMIGAVLKHRHAVYKSSTLLLKEQRSIGPKNDAMVVEDLPVEPAPIAHSALLLQEEPGIEAEDDTVMVVDIEPAPAASSWLPSWVFSPLGR